MGKALAAAVCVSRVLVIEEAAPHHFERLAALFEASGSACHCRYWHFTGTKNEWIERCVMRPEENRQELETALANRDDSARGLVAIEDGVLVGWMKLAPRASLPKLRSLPVYRAIDFSADEALSIGCFLIHPEHRRKGVARTLLHHAARVARDRGFAIVEAYPHVVERAMHDEEAWMGPASIFASQGFAQEAGELPYPVLRLRVRRKTSEGEDPP